MAQAFMTTYVQNYRPHTTERVGLMKQQNAFAEKTPLDGNWIVKENIWDNKESMDAAIEEVRRMYLRRYVTVYQDHYCKLKVDGEKTEEICENILLESCRKLFANRDQALPPPLPSARILFGYMSPKEFYIKRSTYQDVHGRLAFNILEKGYGKQHIDKITSESNLQRIDASTNLVAVDSVELLKRNAIINKHESKRRKALSPAVNDGRNCCCCTCKKC